MPAAQKAPARAGRSTVAPRAARPAEVVADPVTAAALRARSVVAALGALGGATDVRATASAWFGELRLGPALERSLGSQGLVAAPAAVHRAWLLLRIVPPGRSARPAIVARAIADGWLGDGELRRFLDVHDADETTWLRAEPLATLAAWTLALAEIDGGTATGLGPTLDRMLGAAATAGYRVEDWLVVVDGARRVVRARAAGHGRRTRGQASERSARTSGARPRRRLNPPLTSVATPTMWDRWMSANG